MPEFSMEQTNNKGKITIRATENVDDSVDVVCSCGQTTFELRYGCWNIIARCPKCGAEESVYDG